MNGLEKLASVGIATGFGLTYVQGDEYSTAGYLIAGVSASIIALSRPIITPYLKRKLIAREIIDSVMRREDNIKRNNTLMGRDGEE